MGIAIVGCFGGKGCEGGVIARWKEGGFDEGLKFGKEGLVCSEKVCLQCLGCMFTELTVSFKTRVMCRTRGDCCEMRMGGRGTGGDVEKGWSGLDVGDGMVETVGIEVEMSEETEGGGMKRGWRVVGGRRGRGCNAGGEQASGIGVNLGEGTG